MPAKPRTDWTDQLRQIRERLWHDAPPHALVVDIIAESRWNMALTELDLKWLATLRIQP